MIDHEQQIADLKRRLESETERAIKLAAELVDARRDLSSTSTALARAAADQQEAVRMAVAAVTAERDALLRFKALATDTIARTETDLTIARNDLSRCRVTLSLLLVDQSLSEADRQAINDALAETDPGRFFDREGGCTS